MATSVSGIAAAWWIPVATGPLAVALFGVGGLAIALWIAMAALMPAPAKIIAIVCLVFLPLAAMASVRLHEARARATQQLRIDRLRVTSAAVQAVQLSEQPRRKHDQQSSEGSRKGTAKK